MTHLKKLHFLQSYAITLVLSALIGLKQTANQCAPNQRCINLGRKLSLQDWAQGKKGDKEAGVDPYKKFVIKYVGKPPSSVTAKRKKK